MLKARSATMLKPRGSLPRNRSTGNPAIDKPHTQARNFYYSLGALAA